MALIFVVIVIVFHVYAAAEASKRNDDLWFYTILFIPFLGAAAYLLTQRLPEVQRDRSADKINQIMGKTVVSGTELKRLKDRLELADTFHNRKTLAEGYLMNGKYAHALELYESCLDGVYADDPTLIEGIILAHFFSENYPETKSYIFKLQKLRKNLNTHEFDLLLARTHEFSGELDDAKAVYEEIYDVYSGEKARCQYALLLAKLGEKAEALKLFEEILKRVKLSPKFYQKNQAEWLQIAQVQITKLKML